MSRSSDHRGDDLGNDQGALFSETPSRTGLSGTMASLTRPHRSVLLAGLTATTLASAAAILNTALVGRMVDATLRADLQAALGLAVLGILCAAVQVVCAGLGQAWLARAGEGWSGICATRSWPGCCSPRCGSWSGTALATSCSAVPPRSRRCRASSGSLSANWSPR